MSERILIGRVSGASGIKGEIKLFHYSGERERIAGIGELYFARGGEGGAAPEPRRVLAIRYSGRTPVLRIEGLTGRDDAEAMVGADVYADRDALAPLGEGSYYVEDLFGYAVEDGTGRRLGAVAGVIDNPAHDILRIERPGGGEFMLPMVDAFVLAVDEDARRLTVHLPDGIEDV